MKSIVRFSVAFLLLSVPALASDLTLYGGIQHVGKVSLDAVTVAGGDAVQIFTNPFSSGTFGIRVASGKVFGHEATFAYTPHFIDGNSKALNLSSNAILTVPLPVLKPYFTAGLGTFIVSGSGISDIGTRVAVNYGGGVKLLPAGPVGVRADVRGYTLFHVQGGNMNTYEVSLGVLFSF